MTKKSNDKVMNVKIVKSAKPANSIFTQSPIDTETDSFNVFRSLSITDQVNYVKQLHSIIKDVRDTELARLHERMNQLNNLVPAARKSKNNIAKQARAKYRDPVTGKTWSGRGMTCLWMKSYLAKGRNKDEFLIC